MLQRGNAKGRLDEQTGNNLECGQDRNNMTHKPVKRCGKKDFFPREMITFIALGNADGSVIPAHLIIPGKSEKKLYGYALESIDSQSPLRWANFSVS